MTKLTLREQLGNAPSGQLAELYITIRNQRNAHRRLEAACQAKMDFVAGFIRLRMQKEKLKSFQAAGSSVYQYTLHTASAHDPEAFIEYVKESGEFDLLERRASLDACMQYASTHEGNPPPGVTLNAIEKLGVRKGR